MQGEGSSSNPFRENYHYFNNGIGPRGLNLIQLMEAPDRQQDLLGQPGFHQELGRNIGYIDLLTRERSLSPLTGPEFEGWPICEPNTAPYQGETSSGIRQFLSGPSIFQGASSSGALPSGIDLNLPFAHCPSDPAMLTAGTSRYEVEDNVNLQNPSTNDLQGYIPAWLSNGLNGQPYNQAALYFPYEGFPNTSSVVAPLYASPGTQPITQGLNFLQDFQPMQLNRATMFGGFHQEHNLDRASYMISLPDFMTPIFERGYLDNQRNIHMAFPGSTAHAAESITASPHAPSSSSYPQTNWANLRRMENLNVNGSESRGHYHPMHSFHAAANQTEGVSNVGRGHASSSRAGQRVVRRGTRERSSRIRLPTTAERRRRFINEVHEALDIYRREGGGGGAHLQELIALEEQLGITANEEEQIQVVENGLTENTIMARLTRETSHPAAAGAEESRACGICQDEYAEGDLLGKLDCGHDYHFECIKQWLMRKNSCPMCRHRALAI